MTTNEKDILKACKQGNQKAQLVVYQQYAKAMYNTAFRILQQSDKAEDAVQEAFIKAFFSLDSFREESTFGAWLKRIVVNEALTVLRKEEKLISMEEITYKAIDENQQEVWDFQEEEIKILLYVLNQLPEKQRIILNLSLIEGFDNEEICQILNISDGNCRTSLSRAKSTLKETIKKFKNERKYF